MRRRFVVIVILLVFIIGCIDICNSNICRDHPRLFIKAQRIKAYTLSHIGEYRDSALNYTLVISDSRGNISDCLIINIDKTVLPPSPRLTIKHEETHLYYCKLLGGLDGGSLCMSKLNDTLCLNHNPQELLSTSSEVLYFFFVWEGVAIYNELTAYPSEADTMLHQIYYSDCEKYGSNPYNCEEYYQGYLFINYLLENYGYESLDDIVLDIGSAKQLQAFHEFWK